MTREECLALFLLAGFKATRMEELPNGYGKDREDPWWYVKTEHGHIKIGWRKRVIHIEWIDMAVRQWITTDEVTKDMTMVHAWSYVKALEYLTTLYWRAKGLRKIEGGDLMTLREFLDACKQNAFTDDDGIGWLTTTMEPMIGLRTDLPIRPSHSIRAEDTFRPFTHVLWIKR